jgi:hypothetical protein
MLQQALVILIVIAAALFAAWRLPGAATRLRYAHVLQRVGGARNPLRRLGDWLAARELRAMAAGGCAACSARDIHGKPPR